MIKKDKLEHFLVSLIGTCFLSGLGIELINQSIGIIIGSIIMLLIGGFYELYQGWTKTGVASWFDFLADVIGVIIGTIIMFLTR